MNWNKKSVLVTGAGGFIGSHLIDKLVELGANIRAFVRYNSRNDWGLLELIPEERLTKIEVITGDLKDIDAVRHAVEDMDIIFHLGSLIAIPYSYIHPRETIETNVLGALNILTGARENGIEKFVHTSTSEVYGTAKYVPIDESHPLQGQSPYSASKIGADKIVESFYTSYNLPVAIIRPFNTFGPRQSARAVIPTIISEALTRKKIFLGSLHPTRDFTYIKDTIDGFIKVAESSKSVGEVINIGSNFEISIGALVGRIAYLMGEEIQVASDEMRVRPPKSEVERLWCNNTKARELLGWKPTRSLDEGLKETIEWISEHLELYKPALYSR